MKQKLYWCVTTKFFDNGFVKAAMCEVVAEQKPLNKKVENILCDEYTDYFESYEDARKFYNEALNT